MNSCHPWWLISRCMATSLRSTELTRNHYDGIMFLNSLPRYTYEIPLLPPTFFLFSTHASKHPSCLIGFMVSLYWRKLVDRSIHCHSRRKFVNGKSMSLSRYFILIQVILRVGRITWVLVKVHLSFGAFAISDHAP
jgi:hypothetical protein